jgi:ubiquinone/menaquinone biosynthesis C-methylase UbiE
MSNSKYLYKKGFDVYGIDISEIAVDKAKKEIPEGHWIEHDLTEGHLPFNDNMFDVVFSRLSLHYFDNETTMKILDDFCRVLKRDGLLFVSVKIANIGNINTGKVMRTTDEWIKMIEKKFEVTEYEEIVKKPYEFYFIKPLYNFFI